MKHTIVFFLLTYFSLVSAQAQLSEVHSKKIDSLFIGWTEANHPGGSIGIMKNGSVIYSKAFWPCKLRISNTKHRRNYI